MQCLWHNPPTAGRPLPLQTQLPRPLLRELLRQSRQLPRLCGPARPVSQREINRIERYVFRTASNENLLRTGHSRFVDQLNNSVNGMEIVAKFIRMGLFDNQKKPHSVTISLIEWGALLQRLSTTPFGSERQNSDSGSSLASPRRSSHGVNPFEEAPAPRRLTQNANPFFESPREAEPGRTTNPFESSNPFDE